MIRRVKQTIGPLGVIALALGPTVSLFTAVGGQQMPAEYDQAMKTLGKQGDFKDNVLKINIPRNDLKVTIDGIATPTPFGFGGWLAMTKGDRRNGRDDGRPGAPGRRGQSGHVRSPR